MSPEGRSMLRLAGAGLLILALVLLGIVIGVQLGPRAATVEQKVIAPVREAASGRGSADVLPDLVDAACPAIVSIRQAHVAAAPPPKHRKGRRTAAAADTVLTGFIVSPDGYVLTAAAPLSASGAIEVVLDDGRAFDAVRSGSDPLSGLALLKIDASDLPALAFADAGFPRVAQSGLLLASPHGTGCTAAPAVVSGDFLATGAGLRATFQVAPAPDPALVGAPMLDGDGHVLGIAGLQPSDPAAGTGTGELLAAATASRIATELMRHGAPVQNAFGLDAEDLLPVLAERIGADRERGAVISLVLAGSPADRAGLKAGDVVFAANGEPVSSASELARALDTDAKSVKLEVMRTGDRLTLSLQRGG